MRGNHDRPAPSIATLVTLNLLWAGFCALWTLGLALVLLYGIFLSDDQGEDFVGGVLGCTVLAVPGIVGLAVYSAAGIGLWMRRPWGYYLHWAGAILAALTCLGTIYTGFAIRIALRPEFAAAFFPQTVAQSGDSHERTHHIGGRSV